MGLLDPPAGTERTCRYGHGRLANVEGEWALTGIVFQANPPGSDAPLMYPNNKAYALRVLTHQSVIKATYLELSEAVVVS
jgi:hypothetical protein